MNKLQMIANAAYIRARAQFLGMMRGLDAKRNRAWTEYGYKDHLEFADYYNAYDRQALAAAAIELLNDKVWSDTPYIAEGDGSDTLDLDSPAELILAKQFKKARVWDACKLADLMRLVGGYSYAVLRIADNQPFSAPVKANALNSLAGIIPVWLGQMTVNYSVDGDVLNYTYKEPFQNGKTRDVTIHPDRVVPFGDTQNGRPLLKSGYNNLVNIEKITGGGAESFLKNAARQLNMNFEPDVDLNSIATAYGLKDTTELQDVLNKAVEDLNVGNDVLLTTQGASVSPMVTSVPDPQNHFNINLQCFAASAKIPVKMLIGQITGERASTEDAKTFNATCQSWRENELDFSLRTVFDRLVKFGFIPFADYSIVWPNLTDGNLNERSDTAAKLGTAMQAFAASESAALLTGDRPLVSRAEFREILGLSKDG